MGINYYIVKDECEHCGRGDRIHIGKSSAGRQFIVSKEFCDYIGIDVSILKKYDGLECRRRYTDIEQRIINAFNFM